MLAVSRMILFVAALAASAGLAQARNHAPSVVPTPPDRPLLLDVAQTSPNRVGNEAPQSSQSYHGRVDRWAEVKPQPPQSPNEEAAAPTPSDDTAAGAKSPHESGAPTVADLVTRHAQDNGVPVSLAQAVVRIESRGNPRASNRGALGLMQIKPATARAVGFSGGASGLLVADTNLRYGMRVLGEAFRSSGGDVCRALMLYQSGHLATRMTRSNRAYCSKARAIMAGA